MTKKFNITGVCIPEKHYMVDISEKLSGIRKSVEQGDYLTLNRPRQYGKTTTLFLLANHLNQMDGYLALQISLEGIGDDAFQEEALFSSMFQELLHYCIK